MFTGIVDHCGTILKIETINKGLRFWVETQYSDLKLGESIAINGICLTVIDFDKEIFCCDISPETLQVTTAKDFEQNQVVNLERALQLTSRLGGHFMSGHVDKVSRVKKIHKIDDFVEMTFTDIDTIDRKYLYKKGCIAVNGVSLTINNIDKNDFSVMLIPHTLKHTQMATLRENDAVNIEFDMIARIVAEQTQALGSVE